MRYIEVQVTRSENETLSTFVPPWELPLLRLVHGSEKVVETGVDKVTDKPMPDVQAEYERLGSRYRSDPGSSQSYVAMVYGHSSTVLGAAMAEEAEAFPQEPEAGPENLSESLPESGPVEQPPAGVKPTVAKVKTATVKAKTAVKAKTVSKPAAEASAASVM